MQGSTGGGGGGAAGHDSEQSTQLQGQVLSCNVFLFLQFLTEI